MGHVQLQGSVVHPQVSLEALALLPLLAIPQATLGSRTVGCPKSVLTLA